MGIRSPRTEVANSIPLFFLTFHLFQTIKFSLPFIRFYQVRTFNLAGSEKYHFMISTNQPQYISF